MTATRFPRYLTGLAVPYGDKLVRHEADYRTAVVERFARGSIRLVDPAKIPIPLLVEHDWDYPIGKVTRLVDTADGLVVEARLAVPLDQHTTPDQRSLSIGWRGDRFYDRCRYPGYGLPPDVVRRGVDLIEVSVCRRGALGRARILKLSHTDPHPPVRPPPPPEDGPSRLARSLGRSSVAQLCAFADGGIPLSQLVELVAKEGVVDVCAADVEALIPADSLTMREHRWEQERLDLQIQRFNGRAVDRKLDALGIGTTTRHTTTNEIRQHETRPDATGSWPGMRSTNSGSTPARSQAPQVIVRYFPDHQVTIGGNR